MIKVGFNKENKQLPITVKLNGAKQHFTKLAAIELMKKLQKAIDEMEYYEKPAPPCGWVTLK